MKFKRTWSDSPVWVLYKQNYYCSQIKENFLSLWKLKVFLLSQWNIILSIFEPTVLYIEIYGVH